MQELLEATHKQTSLSPALQLPPCSAKAGATFRGFPHPLSTCTTYRARCRFQCTLAACADLEERCKRRRTVAAAQYSQATVRAYARQIELIQIPQVLMGISPLERGSERMVVGQIQFRWQGICRLVQGQVAPASPVVCQRRARWWHHLLSPRDAAAYQKVLPVARLYSYASTPLSTPRT